MAPKKASLRIDAKDCVCEFEFDNVWKKVWDVTAINSTPSPGGINTTNTFDNDYSEPGPPGPTTVALSVAVDPLVEPHPQLYEAAKERDQVNFRFKQRAAEEVLPTKVGRTFTAVKSTGIVTFQGATDVDFVTGTKYVRGLVLKDGADGYLVEEVDATTGVFRVSGLTADVTTPKQFSIVRPQRIKGPGLVTVSTTADDSWTFTAGQDSHQNSTINIIPVVPFNRWSWA